VADALSAKLFQMKNVHLASPAAVEKINAADPVPKIAQAIGRQTDCSRNDARRGRQDRRRAALERCQRAQLWTKDFPGVRQDLLTIEDQIYNELVTALELKPSDEELARNALRPTENVAAYELYLKGRDILRGKRDVKRVESAVDLVRASHQERPRFALAYAGLADASIVMYNLTQDPAGRRRRSAPPSMRNRSTMSFPKSTLRWAMRTGSPGKTAEAIVELKRALELAPNSDEGYRRLGDAYLAAGQGRRRVPGLSAGHRCESLLLAESEQAGYGLLPARPKRKAIDAFRRV
jgi:tetratricopeptide (TPR) repeat protein